MAVVCKNIKGESLALIRGGGGRFKIVEGNGWE